MNARNRILLLAGAVALVAIATGCAPKYPNCRSDDDCNVDGHTGVCVNGLCQECANDSHCPEGFKCERDSAGGNRCVPAAECQTNRDCSGGRVCQNGSCVACSSDSQCGHGYECVNGACRPAAECSEDADCGSGQSCVEGKCVATAPPCQQEPVRFAFDSYALTDEARSSLQRLAECLRQNRVTVTLEGHCDERGTEEYNMALGERRASAVKRYLVNLGIEENRLRTVSYGKERPVAYGHNEEAWAQNRRVEFVITR